MTAGRPLLRVVEEGSFRLAALAALLTVLVNIGICWLTIWAFGGTVRYQQPAVLTRR